MIKNKKATKPPKRKKKALKKKKKPKILEWSTALFPGGHCPCSFRLEGLRNQGSSSTSVIPQREKFMVYNFIKCLGLCQGTGLSRLHADSFSNPSPEILLILASQVPVQRLGLLQFHFRCQEELNVLPQNPGCNCMSVSAVFWGNAITAHWCSPQSSVYTNWVSFQRCQIWWWCSIWPPVSLQSCWEHVRL